MLTLTANAPKGHFKTHSLHWPCQTVSLMYCRLFTNGSRQSWHRCWAVEESSAAQTPCSFMVINETPAHRAPLSASTDHFGLSGPRCIFFMLSDLYQGVVHIYEVHSPFALAACFFLHLLSMGLDINHTSLTSLCCSCRCPYGRTTSRIIERNAPVLHEVGLRSRLVLARVLVVNV